MHTEKIYYRSKCSKAINVFCDILWTSCKKPPIPANEDPGSAIDGTLPPETNYGRRNGKSLRILSMHPFTDSQNQMEDLILQLRAEINEQTARIQQLEREKAEMKKINNEVHEAAVIFKDQREELEKKARVKQQKLDETTAELDNLRKKRLDDCGIVVKVQQEVENLKLEAEKWQESDVQVICEVIHLPFPEQQSLNSESEKSSVQPRSEFDVRLSADTCEFNAKMIYRI
uniref:Uncharacterized protein n=1 Tax=Panagrolaimus sp. JU765 TaxID=591449 RepID=A0AC34RPR7_9BILA